MILKILFGSQGFLQNLFYGGANQVPVTQAYFISIFISNAFNLSLPQKMNNQITFIFRCTQTKRKLMTLLRLSIIMLKNIACKYIKQEISC